MPLKMYNFASSTIFFLPKYILRLFCIELHLSSLSICLFIFKATLSVLSLTSLCYCKVQNCPKTINQGLQWLLNGSLEVHLFILLSSPNKKPVATILLSIPSQCCILAPNVLVIQEFEFCSISSFVLY